MVSIKQTLFVDPSTNGQKIPKRPHSIEDAATPKWAEIKFSANDFPDTELSFLKTPVARDITIGEQQSRATVTAMSWSSPGLARHSRPALAVLTTNHVLCIWASTYNVEESSSWERVLIINGADSRFGRVRSMKWASSCPLKPESGRRSYQPSMNILAMGLDGGKVVFLDIRSPSSAGNGSWSCRTLDEVDLETEPALRLRRNYDDTVSITRTSRYSLFGDAMKTLHFVGSINFSSWINSRSDFITTASFCGNDGSRWMCDFRVSDDLSDWDCNLLE